MTRDELCERIPHAGSMCLIDRLTAWDADSISCSTGTHRDPGNPLRYDGHLSAVHVVEYAGQAAALHRALAQPTSGRSEINRTLLAAVSEVQLEVRFLDLLDGSLDISAVRELSSNGNAIYRFLAASREMRIAQGRFSVMRMRPIKV